METPTITAKRKKNPSSPSPQQEENEDMVTVESQLLTDIATTMSESEKHSIRKHCEGLLAKISSQKGDQGGVLSMEEAICIVQDWRPKQEILCLYVRIARKLPANFHLDSISTLLCISKQCDYTPVNFLTKTKSLHISPSGGRYGFSFLFKTISNKETLGHELDRKFVGLSLTLTLLEHTVSNSCGVISRDGMRSGAPREPVTKSLDLGGSTNVSFKTMPSHEFHKRSSLIHRLWLAINHRWIAYHLAQHLFDSHENLCEKNELLIYSFMMHAGCGRSRYDFLDPMVGICFRFISREELNANRNRLSDLWKTPSSFLTYGRNCLQRDDKERKIRILIDTFNLMKNGLTRTTSYGRAIKSEQRWLMLRAYIFSFWLKRESNAEIRLQVESALVVSKRPPSKTATSNKAPDTHNPAPSKVPLAPQQSKATMIDIHPPLKRQCLGNCKSQEQLWLPENLGQTNK